MEREDWDRRYRGTELVWTAQPNRFVVQELRGLPPGRPLDLGCGEGRNAVWLAEGGWQVTAADFSPVALDTARRLAQARGVTVHWELEDLRDYEPEPGAYNLFVPAARASGAAMTSRWLVRVDDVNWGQATAPVGRARMKPECSGSWLSHRHLRRGGSPVAKPPQRGQAQQPPRAGNQPIWAARVVGVGPVGL